jgi:hypothetical protein
LLFTTQKYSSFSPPYFPKRTLKFFLDSIPACSVKLMLRPAFHFEVLETMISWLSDYEI